MGQEGDEGREGGEGEEGGGEGGRREEERVGGNEGKRPGTARMREKGNEEDQGPWGVSHVMTAFWILIDYVSCSCHSNLFNRIS